MEKLIKYNFVFCLWIFPLTTFFRYFLLYLGYNDFFLNFDYSICYKIILVIQVILYLLSIKNKFIKLNYFDYIVWILLIAAAISSLGAMNYNVSIFGYGKRYEGFIAITTYYLLFLNARILNRKDIDFILNNIVFIGLFNLFYSILQVIFKAPFVIKFKLPWMASGLNFNPNFFGTFMCVTGLLSVCMFLFKEKNKFFNFISSLTMVFCLVLSQSFGPIVGYFFGIFILLFFIILKKINILTKYFKILLVLIIVFGFSVYSTNYLFKKVYKYENIDNYMIKSDIDRIINYFDNNLNSSEKLKKNNSNEIETEKITLNDISTNRLKLWKDSLPIIKDNLLLGVGLDNFGIAYNKYYGNSHFDKVHNVYLQILATNGIIGFVPYIILLVMIIYLGCKKSSKNIIILLIPFIGYSFQAIFNISVVDVAPLFYILGGMIVGFKEE